MTIPSAVDGSAASKCIVCGADITPTAKFCSECGTIQTKKPDETAVSSGSSEEPSIQSEVITPSRDDEGLKLLSSTESTAVEVIPKAGRTLIPLLILGGLIVAVVLIMIVRTAERSPQAAGLQSATLAQPLTDSSSPDANTNTRLMETLRNMTYVFHHRNGVESVKLVDGKAETDGDSYDLSNVVIGDLNGDGKADAVAVIGESGGGSGYFEGLVAAVNNNGTITNSEMFDLGDRVHINSLEVKNQVVTVDMITQGPNDPMCCPSFHKVLKLTLAGNQLVEARTTADSKDESSSSPASPDKVIYGTVLRIGSTQGLGPLGFKQEMVEISLAEDCQVVGSFDAPPNNCQPPSGGSLNVNLSIPKDKMYGPEIEVGDYVATRWLCSSSNPQSCTFVKYADAMSKGREEGIH